MSAFNLGVRWGVFIASVYDDDNETEGARLAAIDSLIDAISARGMHETGWAIEALTTGYDDYRCHGRLSDGAVCGNCGAVRGEA